MIFAGTEFSTSGLVTGDTVNSVTLTSNGAAATASVSGSPYSIVASAAVGSGLSNYSVSYVKGALTVNTAPLTVTANDTSKVQGTANPTFTAQYSGFVNGQTSSNLSGKLTFTTAATTSSPTGTYPVTPGGLTSSNYVITSASGTLTITSVASGLTLAAPAGTTPYTPAQVRSAYGINSLAEDGTGQTIAIVDAYNDPNIVQALDTFDTQFGLTLNGPSLYQQYGPASSFLTVLNQDGQPTSLPTTDPNGPGTDNWEVEEALDVEWAHAIAPGARIILVEANSQSLSDLMAGVATAASQPGVSVVSMSWGFPEGQTVFASDEATYDRDFQVPGVTFVASTGDNGAADPQYPAYSPNVVAVGGTSLLLNPDGTYASETGWGYYSDSLGASIGSGGGLSLYEPEPAYQQGVQSTGSRTTPDVSFVADPATGVWVADPYNLPASAPFELVGGTSLSAPAWAGLLALTNQGRAAAGEPALNSSSPTDTQQALYKLPQSAYHAIAGGSSGFTASTGSHVGTGLGTPVANLLIPDLVASQGSGSSGTAVPKVGPLQDATRRTRPWARGFDSLVDGSGDSPTVAAGLVRGHGRARPDFPVHQG